MLFPLEYYLDGNIVKETKRGEKKEGFQKTDSSSNFICIQKYIIMGKAYYCFQLYIINYKYFHKSILNYREAMF